MMKCWASDPRLRPTFSDLLATFENLMDVSVADNYENVSTCELTKMQTTLYSHGLFQKESIFSDAACGFAMLLC